MTTETALITGASARIGREMARLFAAQQSNLVQIARRRERLEELAAELRKQHSVEVRVMAADLAQADAPQTIVDSLTSQQVAVDVLVNYAAKAYVISFREALAYFCSGAAGASFFNCSRVAAGLAGSASPPWSWSWS